MSEICLRGLPASPGILIGILVIVARSVVGRARLGGDPGTEMAALDTAIAVAIAELKTLSERVSGEAADILEFQIEMLGDVALAGPARNDILAGCGADKAWLDTMAVQIADYQAAADEYFQARAADLDDLGQRVLRHLRDVADTPEIPPGAIVALEDLAPSQFLSADWSSGGAIALAKGSPTSHVAMLARARGVPMVVGLGAELLRQVSTPSVQGTTAALDGGQGLVVLAPSLSRRHELASLQKHASAAEARSAAFRDRPAVTADGTRIDMLINIAHPSELDGIDPALCDGIGLVRTELLFHRQGALPDEEEQFAAYRHIVAWANGRPVTFRTLDAGGDKPIAGLTVPGESNPFLGLRGLRLSLARPEVFTIQLRALCRVAALGPVKIMLPMVSIPDELARARLHLGQVLNDLARAGLAHARPELGIMVEVPAVALTPERFEVDFFSIGSNDLTQYVLAAARDLDSVANLADPVNPAMLRLMTEVAAHGRTVGRAVSLCGDAAADPVLVPALLGTGLRALSMAPAAIGRVKAAIASVRLDGNV